ncbi:MAG: ATPase, T2SS/T4P/T4SS family [archaeon]
MMIIEKYDIELEGIKINIAIEGENGKALEYKFFTPKLAPATLALLSEVRKSLMTEVSISTAEILDPRLIEETKDKFRQRASTMLDERIKLEKDIKQIMICFLMKEMLGLGDMEFLINDPNLEEVVILSPKEPIRVFHKKYGWLQTNIVIESDEKIMNYANIIARRVGRQVTVLTPLLDAHMVSGDRANAVLYPISTKGHTITIRKFARDPWTFVDLIKNDTITSKVVSLIWLAIQYEMNVIISGGTASGKTSILNAVIPFIPPNQRILTIEQTRELQLPSFLYWCPLVTRLPNPEGKGEVNMLDLLINALRMRPDRIVMGEIRRKEEAEVLFEAMHTGHSVYATLHANTITETINRLSNPPISIPANLLQGVNLCVVMFRDRRKGVRRLYQIGEFISSEEPSGVKISPNILYRYRASDDKVIPHSKSLSFIDSIERVTGMTQQEINADLAEKEKIIDFLVLKNIRSIEEIGAILKDYYIDKTKILKQIK